jgi:hypothetical protein
MREEALAEGDECVLDPESQFVARLRAFLSTGVAPGLERALGGGLISAAEAGLVRQQPQCGEVGVTLLGE